MSTRCESFIGQTGQFKSLNMNSTGSQCSWPSRVKEFEQEDACSTIPAN